MANLLPTVTTLFLLLLTLTTGDAYSDLVVDVDGNPLEVGSQYYIQRGLSSVGAIGRSDRRGTCPLYVVQYPHETQRDDPLKFVPVDETQKEIHLSSDVKFDSGFSAYCRDDGLWRLSYDAPNRRVVVIASGIFNQPRASFKIKQGFSHALVNMYKITTPSVVKGFHYLTVFHDSLSGMDMVGLTDDPIQATDDFVFVKYSQVQEGCCS